MTYMILKYSNVNFSYIFARQQEIIRMLNKNICYNLYPVGKWLRCITPCFCSSRPYDIHIFLNE